MNSQERFNRDRIC